RRHTRFSRDWSSDVCSSDLPHVASVHGDQAKAVAADDGPGLDDDPPADFHPIHNGHLGVNHGVIADLDARAHVYAGVDAHVAADAAAGADVGVGAHRGTLAQR